MFAFPAGWTVIFLRSDLSDWPTAYATWQSPFGSLCGPQYWFGLDNLRSLTASGTHRLRVELQRADNGQWMWAEYSGINFGTVWWYGTTYNDIHFSSYSGNAGSVLCSGCWFMAGDFNNGGSAQTDASCGWWFNGNTCTGCLPGKAPNYYQWNGIQLAASRMLVK